MTSKSDKQARLRQWASESGALLERTTAAARAINNEEARLRADETERFRTGRLEQSQAGDHPAETTGNKKDR